MAKPLPGSINQNSPVVCDTLPFGLDEPSAGGVTHAFLASVRKKWGMMAGLLAVMAAVAVVAVTQGAYDILSLNPDVIFIDSAGLPLVREDYRRKPDFYRALTAVKAKRVYPLFPFNYYTTNIDTAMADAYAIGKILFPDRFADVDLAAKADEVYTFLVGRPVYTAMQADFGRLGEVVGFIE